MTSVPDLVDNIPTLDPIQSGIITDHSTIVFQLRTSIRAATRLGRTVYDYRRTSIRAATRLGRTVYDYRRTSIRAATRLGRTVYDYRRTSIRAATRLGRTVYDYRRTSIRAATRLGRTVYDYRRTSIRAATRLGRTVYDYRRTSIRAATRLGRTVYDYRRTSIRAATRLGRTVYDYRRTSIRAATRLGRTVYDYRRTSIRAATRQGRTVYDYRRTSIRAATRLGRTVYDYRRGRFDELRSALKSTNLCNIIQSDDVNRNWLRWRNTFQAIVNYFIPTKGFKGRNSPPWINGEIIHDIRKKEAIRRKLKRSHTNYLRNRFKELRTKVKSMVSERRAHFFNSLLDLEFKRHPKRFWSIFKLKSKTSSVPERVFGLRLFVVYRYCNPLCHYSK